MCALSYAGAPKVITLPLPLLLQLHALAIASSSQHCALWKVAFMGPSRFTMCACKALVAFQNMVGAGNLYPISQRGPCMYKELVFNSQADVTKLVYMRPLSWLIYLW